MSAPPATSPTASARSVLADRTAAQQAVEMALPMIESAMQHTYVGESGFLYIVVMDPAARPGQCAADDAVLYEHSVGDRAKWDADYGMFARAKAFLAWRTQMDSHVLQTRYPHLLEPGDTTLWGSVVLDGIVVGVSGANAWYDEAFATAVAGNLRAIVKARAHAADRPLFLPR